MKKAMLVVMLVFAFAGFMMAQNWSSPVDVLGAHNNQGRGCAGCHAPHSGSFGSGHGGGADAGSYALWGQDASPLYGATIAFGDQGKYTETLPTSISTGSTEVGGILLCLSCHDGNVTQSNMMTNQSYEQRIGLLTNTTYGTKPIPTLLGNDGTVAGNYTNDHPVGQLADISTGSGLVFNGTSMSVTAGTPYAQYVANYGYPALAPGKYSQPFGVTAGGFTTLGYFTSTRNALTASDVVTGIVKSFVFGLIITAVGCQEGFSTGAGAQEVGRSTTSAVVRSILMVILVDVVFTIFFYITGGLS